MAGFVAESVARMRLLYNILFPFFLLFSAPFYFWKMCRRGNWRKGFGERFGLRDDALKKELAGQRVMWLHAVSVGEANLCVALVETLREKLDGWTFVVSTTTTTGMGELQAKLPAEVRTFYYPIDLFFCVRQTLDTVEPDAIVLLEAEIWPNLSWQAADRGIPVCLANARLSDRSERGYRRFGFLFKKCFVSLAAVGAQNELDARRLQSIGCREKAVHVTGNLKFDGALSTPEPTVDVSAILQGLGAAADAPVIVAGSTHEGEERLLAEIFLKLKKQHPGLLLVIVPRHFERAQSVGAQLKETGVSFAYRSKLAKDTRADCLVVDSTGELRLFYAAATVVFVGKSLTTHGGQNPIEPAALGKAMVYGPNMQNFRAVTTAFADADAALQVRNAAGLEVGLAALLRDAKRRAEMGRNALGVVEQNQGATRRTTDMIARVLQTRSSDRPD